MYSNGSVQAAHRYSALHAVPLNAAVCCAPAAPQRGQATWRGAADSVSGTGPAARRGAGFGGAIPAAAS